MTGGEMLRSSGAIRGLMMCFGCGRCWATVDDGGVMGAMECAALVRRLTRSRHRNAVLLLLLLLLSLAKAMA